MAVTIHIPEIHTPNLRNLAVAGVAVLVAATAVLGIQTLTDSSTNVGTSVATSEVTSTQSLVNGPSSNVLGPLAHVAAATAPATQSGGFATTEQFMEANVGSYTIADASAIGVATPTTQEVTTQSGGFATTEQFMEANVGSFYSPDVAALDLSAVQSIVGVPSVDAIARLVGIGVAAPTKPAQFTAATMSSFFTPVAPGISSSAVQSIVGVPSVDAIARLVGIGVAAPTTTEATIQSGGNTTTETFMETNETFGSAAHATTAATATQYDPYPAETTDDADLHRSNFASDIEWLEANGWD